MRISNWRQLTSFGCGTFSEARSEDADEEDEDTDEKPLNAMADGETVDVKGGAYRIKRTGDHYYCT